MVILVSTNWTDAVENNLEKLRDETAQTFATIRVLLDYISLLIKRLQTELQNELQQQDLNCCKSDEKSLEE